MPKQGFRFPIASGLRALLLAEGPLAASLETTLARIIEQPLRVGEYDDAEWVN